MIYLTRPFWTQTWRPSHACSLAAFITSWSEQSGRFLISSSVFNSNFLSVSYLNKNYIFLNKDANFIKYKKNKLFNRQRRMNGMEEIEEIKKKGLWKKGWGELEICILETYLYRRYATFG